MADSKWEESLDPKWTRAVYDAYIDGTIEIIVRRDEVTSVTVSGPCPNCLHDFADTDVLTGPVDIGAVLGGPGVSPPVERFPPAALRCRCREGHRGRPANVKEGCGVHFKVNIEPEDI